MSLFAVVVNMVGFNLDTETRKLLKKSKATREALIETAKEANEALKRIERRVNPDDTCQGERRWNHLRKYK